MTSGSYLIRPVSVENLIELQEISLQTFRETFAEQNDPEQLSNYLKKAFESEKLKLELQNPDSFFYFLKEGTKTLGYLKLNTKSAQSDNVLDSALEIERIYVFKNEHGKGLGNFLMNFALEEARKRNLLCVWLGVWERNTKAITFYERHGFETFANHPFKLGDETQKDLLMKRFI